MNRTLLLSVLILCSAAVADADTYKWTDDQGVVNVTNDPAQIPSRYRGKALKTREINTPAGQQEENVLKDELATPRSVTTPDSGQSTPPPAGMPPPAPPPPAPVAVPAAPVAVPAAPMAVPAAPVPAAPLGAQPTPSPGMKQPAPAQ